MRLTVILLFGVWQSFPLSPVGTCHGQDATVAEDGRDEENVQLPFQWQRGPTLSPIGDIAEIQVPAGYQFADKEGTQFLMQVMENPVDGSELGIIMPTSEDDASDWFVVFQFSDVGYVPDDEKDDLDADAMLESMRRGNEEGNKERRKRGWATLELIGWEVKPQYDAETNNLEWAVRAESNGEPVLNYNTRILGRRGVMEANLVVDPEDLAATLPLFRSLLAGYTFTPGQKYAEYRQGDKIAKLGLTALVTGGAAAVALKTGLFKKFWKLIVLGFIAIGGFFKKLFGGGRATPEQA
jgi:uncharacterized membrane-anchored protein